MVLRCPVKKHSDRRLEECSSPKIVHFTSGVKNVPLRLVTVRGSDFLWLLFKLDLAPRDRNEDAEHPVRVHVLSRTPVHSWRALARVSKGVGVNA